jgi:hypothetical protein
MEREQDRKPRSKPEGRKGARHDKPVGAPLEDDEAVGSWSKLDYETMDHAFREALARAVKQGQ